MPQADTELPVAGVIDSLRDTLRTHGRVVLEAPPGAGKTTLVPSALLDEGWPGEILLLQPRRVAARAVAAMLARRNGGSLGDAVGYQIRFERKTSKRTRLRVITEGILTAWLQRDPELTGVSAVVLDEFHERSLQADLALALLREVQEALRPDLKLVVMSATLDTSPIARYLGGCPVLRCEGRQYPLEITYEAKDSKRPVAAKVARAVREIAEAMDKGETPNGSILAFLPGVREIDATIRALGDSVPGRDVLPLHGRLSGADQDRVLEAGRRPRIVVATNIAETSLTLPGITAVVDSGLVRVSRFDPGLGVSRLETRATSQASAAQRAGRAGRLGPGRAHRLWTEFAHKARPAYDEPEIRRLDLAPLVLALRAWGVGAGASFDFYDAPEASAIARAERVLTALGALSEDGALTEIGRRLRKLPIAPRIGRALVAAEAEGLLDQALWLAAILSERHDTRSRGHGAADAIAALEALGRDSGTREGRHLSRLARQLGRSMGATPAPLTTLWDVDGLCRALFWGWSDRLCRRPALERPELVMVGGRGATLDSKSVVQADELLLGIDVDAGRRGERSRSLVRSAARVDLSWLQAHADIVEGEVVRWDSERHRVVAVRERTFRDLVLSSRSIPLSDREAAAVCLAEAARKEPGRALLPDDAAKGTFHRMALVARLLPGSGLPADPWAWLVERLPELCVGRASFEELRKLSLSRAALELLPWSARQTLEREAPTHVEVPSGRRAALVYPVEGAPSLAIKVQEVFGWSETPTVCGGRQPIVLHLLNPAGRPLQVTRDLESFWSRTWVEVRKEMRSRYPKHRWPEDPRTAIPSQRTTKRRR
ncbi:MAG: ATP-dependent helicase HrpB [Myxococcota bacterium]